VPSLPVEYDGPWIEDITRELTRIAALDPAGFTRSSWERVAEAVEFAESLLPPAIPTTGDVADAIDGLTDAVEDLEERGQTEQLTFIVALVDSRYDPDRYASVALLEAALEAAQEFLADDSAKADASQADVDRLAQELLAAVLWLTPAPDTSAVEAARASLEAVLVFAATLTEELYESTSYDRVAAAIAAGQDLVSAASPSSDVAALQAAQSALQVAIAALVPAFPDPVDPDQAAAAREAAQAAAQAAEAAGQAATAAASAAGQAGQAITQAAGAAEAAALAAQAASEAAGAAGRASEAASEAAGSAGRATQAASDAANRAAQAAADSAAAARAAAEDGLAEIIAVADGLDGAAYTEASWNAFSAALNTARAVLANGSATTGQLQAAQARLSVVAALLASKPQVTTVIPVSPAPAEVPTASAGAPKPETDKTTQVAKVRAAQTTVRLVRGESLNVPAYAYLADGRTEAGVTFTSSAPRVATVSKTGIIAAKRVGTASITVRSAGGKKAVIAVRVVAKASPAKVSAVTVKGIPARQKVGQVSWASVAWKSAAATGARVTYRSADPSIVSIDKAGRIVAKAPGSTTIQVKVAKKAKTIAVTVTG
jgi:hypothetical protein